MKSHHHHHHHHHHLLLLIPTFLVLLLQATQTSATDRRILHQPLYPETDPPPPPETTTPTTPYPNPDIPFSPEVPNPDQTTPSPPPPPQVNDGSAGAVSIPAAPQPAKPTKKLAIAISVGIVCLGMLSALVFFLFRHRAKQSSDAQKLFDNRNEPARPVNHPQSNFLYIGTVEPSSRRFAAEEENGANHSPYRKLTSAEKFSSRYRPSPELQPLPSLVRPLSNRHSRSVMSGSSEDDESSETSFYTPNGSLSDTPAYDCNNKNVSLLRPGTNEENNKSTDATLVGPHSRRTSPKSNLHPPSPPPPPPIPALIPSIKALSSLTQQDQNLEDKSHQRPRFPAPPPQPNLALIPSLCYKQQSPSCKSHIPPPPPPPPPLLPLSNRSLQQKEAHISSKTNQPPTKLLQQQLETPIPTAIPSAEQENRRDSNSIERQDSDDVEGGKPKLKPLHWDKVRAISHRETVWDQLKSSSFQ